MADFERLTVKDNLSTVSAITDSSKLTHLRSSLAHKVTAAARGYKLLLNVWQMIRLTIY
jgi:hypothetical protein